MRAQNVVLRLGAAAEHRCDTRNPYAPTEIPHEIENAGGVSQLLFGNAAHRHSRERHEDETHRNALEELRPKDIPISDLQIKGSQREQRYCASH